MNTAQEVWNDCSALAKEYQELSNLKFLNEYQEDRLSHIINIATTNSALDKLVQDIDLSLLSEDDKCSIANQQAKMREYLKIGCQRQLLDQLMATSTTAVVTSGKIQGKL